MIPENLPRKYLFVAGIIAPAVIAVPATAIAAKQYLTIEQAQRVMFPSAEQFVPIPIKPTEDELKKFSELADDSTDEWLARIWRVEEAGRLQGYFIVDDVIGKHDYISYAVALSNEGVISAVELLEYRETKGGEIERQSWREQFKGKSGSDSLVVGESIANISGATLSCKHVTAGVRRILALYQVKLKR